MQTMKEMIKASEKTADIGRRLLDEGHTISYAADDLNENEFVSEHPNGDKFISRMVDGEFQDCEPYDRK